MSSDLKYISIDPMEYPIRKGESWWVVSPNDANCKFQVPQDAITLCTEDFSCFSSGVVYRISGDFPSVGFLVVVGNGHIVKMPYYVFARYFDAEAFIQRVDMPKRQRLERFDD